jgi:hypothetical protein
MFIFGPIVYALVFLLFLGFIKLLIKTLKKVLKSFLILVAFIIMIIVPIAKILEQIPFELLLFDPKFFALIVIILLSGLNLTPNDRRVLYD